MPGFGSVGKLYFLSLLVKYLGPGAQPGRVHFPPEIFKTLHSCFDNCRNFQRIKMKFYILIIFKISYWNFSLSCSLIISYKIYLETGYLIENLVIDWHSTTNMLELSTWQRWSDSGFLLSDPILFWKNDIRSRSESCFGWNHTIRIRKLSESVLWCTTYIFVLCLFRLMRQNSLMRQNNCRVI